MDRTLSRICTCYICNKSQLTNREELPAGWVITWEMTVTICEECVGKWIRKWGEPPAIWKQGGEEELKLL